MVVAIALGLALGIALAQFCNAFALAPATMVAGAGTFLIETAGGHTVAHALLASFCITSALQLGFLFGVLFNGLVVRSRRTSARLREEEPSLLPPSLAEAEIDKMQQKLAAMKGLLKIGARGAKKDDAA
jgi:hypothetical protein